jgi:SAM-dependent methyltransferase
VVAVEPSATMIRQRPANAPPVVRAVAEDLPFPARSFDVGLAVLTVHHWSDPAQGLAEMRRVAERLVILTWDPEVYRRFWLLEEYIPELADAHSGRGGVQHVLSLVPDASVAPLAVPWDCMDGFGAAYWRRPHMYLDPGARLAISGFALCAPGIVDAAMSRLAEDLRSGVWAERHGRLLELDEIDAGYRLVVADRQFRREGSV